MTFAEHLAPPFLDKLYANLVVGRQVTPGEDERTWIVEVRRSGKERHLRGMLSHWDREGWVRFQELAE